MKFLRQWMRGNRSFHSHREVEKILDRRISYNLQENLEIINRLFSHTPDLVTNQFYIGDTDTKAAIVFIKDLVDKTAVNDNILYPLKYGGRSLEEIEDAGITIGHTDTVQSWRRAEQSVFYGKTLLFIDGKKEALYMDTSGWPQRSIQEPQTESTVKGSHQGFVEIDYQNIALIRRYVPSRELKIKQMRVGRRAETRVSLLYMADVAKPEIVKEIEDRIGQVDVDAIINTGELEELIEDNPYTPFPQFFSTERPDSAASSIFQGRIVVVVDHSPAVLVGPATFVNFFQTVDDYSTRSILASFFRLLRFFAFFIAIFLPSLYIAVISFHYEVIPLDLILSVGESREKVPFPPIIEALIMELTIEMLRESGLRLPAPVGQTVGVVGGIVIGQAAVQAGIVSNIMVIVVSITAISSFIIPNNDMSLSLRLVRFPMMILASLFGMVGIAIGLMFLVAHIISLESLGTPYGSPLAPMRFSDWKDVFVRLPMWKMDRRPLQARPTQQIRQDSNRKRGDDK